MSTNKKCRVVAVLFPLLFLYFITLVIFQLLSADYSDYRVDYNETSSQGVMSVMSIVDLFYSRHVC